MRQKGCAEKKSNEKSNHLGNVLVTVSDRKLAVDDNSDGTVDYYTADVTSAQDYFPFGMLMPGRSFNPGTYRYGLNGMELDDEISGTGNSYTAMFWQYDPRLGRRWNTDPLTYSWQSTYAAFNNNPILFNDPSGAQGEEAITTTVKKGDNLTQIAKAFNTTVEQIVADNDINDPDLIFPGQVLVVGQSLPTVEINAQEQESKKLQPLDLSKSKNKFKDVVGQIRKISETETVFDVGERPTVDEIIKPGSLKGQTSFGVSSEDLFFSGKKVQLVVVSNVRAPAGQIKAGPTRDENNQVLTYEVRVVTIHHHNLHESRGKTQYNLIILRFQPEDRELFIQVREFVKGNNILFE